MEKHSRTPSALATAERNLAGQLPALIDIAVESYRRFAQAESPDDPKAYAAQQSACKAALAHLDLLLRLARALLPKAGSEMPAPEVDALIAEARARAGLDREAGE
ncbi:MAG: hypothetical protein WEA84_14360 [Rhodovibrionaceae bacterium]